MRVVVDTREQQPWTFEDPACGAIETTRAKLEAGDYSVEGLERRVSIERKSLGDWVGTVIRDRARFYRELAALRAYEFRAVIIEAGVREILAGRYASATPPKSVLGFVAEVAVRQAVPVYLAGTRAEAQVLAAGFLRTAGRILTPSE